MHPFRRLAVWEKSHALVILVYAATESAAARRYPGLVAQLRRSAASVPANIVEGAGHSSQAQFSRHLAIAIASARETEYHLLLAKDLGAIDLKTYAGLEARVGAVCGMLFKLRSRIAQGIKAASTEAPTRRRKVVERS